LVVAPVAVALTAIAWWSVAATPAPQVEAAATGGRAKAQAHTIVGELISADLEARQLTLSSRAGGASRKVRLILGRTSTRVVRQGRKAELSDLRPGDRILASCPHHEGDEHFVRVVRVIGPSPIAPPSVAPGKP
jgi:hypothetical protein